MRRVLIVLAMWIAGSVGFAAQSRPQGDLDAVLGGVRTYLADYFARAQSIVADEAVTIQPIGSDMMPEAVGARTLRNELRLSWEPTESGGIGAAEVLRNLISVNGRPPREKDRDKCFDPKATSPEMLAVLFLSDDRENLRYSISSRRKLRGRPAIAVEIRDTSTGPLQTVVSEDEQCIGWQKPGSQRWRVTLDAENYSVMRYEQYLSAPMDVQVPRSRKHGTPERQLVVDRFTETIDYQLARFNNPDEAIMLPTSREVVQIFRGPGSMRTSYRYRNYRRFMTGIRIVQ